MIATKINDKPKELRRFISDLDKILKARKQGLDIIISDGKNFQYDHSLSQILKGGGSGIYYTVCRLMSSYSDKLEEKYGYLASDEFMYLAFQFIKSNLKKREPITVSHELKGKISDYLKWSSTKKSKESLIETIRKETGDNEYVLDAINKFGNEFNAIIYSHDERFNSHGKFNNDIQYDISDVWIDSAPSETYHFTDPVLSLSYYPKCYVICDIFELSPHIFPVFKKTEEGIPILIFAPSMDVKSKRRIIEFNEKFMNRYIYFNVDWATIEDIAALSGASVLNRDIQYKEYEKSHAGIVENVTITEDYYSMVGDYESERYLEHLIKLKNQNSDDKRRLNRYQRRNIRVVAYSATTWNRTMKKREVEQNIEKAKSLANTTFTYSPLEALYNSLEKIKYNDIIKDVIMLAYEDHKKNKEEGKVYSLEQTQNTISLFLEFVETWSKLELVIEKS